jgi:hypothetical protein
MGYNFTYVNAVAEKRFRVGISYFTLKNMLKQSIFIITLVSFLACSSNKNHNSDEQKIKNEESTNQPKNKEWKTLIKFSGTSKKNSEKFEVKEGQIKIIYKVEQTGTSKGNDITTFELSVAEKDEGIWGSPTIHLLNQAESSETFVDKPAGSYFVHIEAIGTKCEVEVQTQQ